MQFIPVWLYAIFGDISCRNNVTSLEYLWFKKIHVFWFKRFIYLILHIFQNSFSFRMWCSNLTFSWWPHRCKLSGDTQKGFLHWLLHPFETWNEKLFLDFMPWKWYFQFHEERREIVFMSPQNFNKNLGVAESKISLLLLRFIFLMSRIKIYFIKLQVKMKKLRNKNILTAVNCTAQRGIFHNWKF